MTGQEVAALNRLTIAVAVVFEDRVEQRERLRRTFTASADYDPAWSADGKSIAFVSDRNANENIYTKDAHGPNQNQGAESTIALISTLQHGRRRAVAP